MFRIVLFVAGCVAGYIASGYFDGLMDTEEDNSSSSTKKAEAES